MKRDGFYDWSRLTHLVPRRKAVDGPGGRQVELGTDRVILGTLWVSELIVLSDSLITDNYVLSGHGGKKI